MTCEQTPLFAKIVRRLVRAVDPDRLILFGSRARARLDRVNDYDILIVKPSTETRYHRLRPGALSALGYRVPIDLLWYTPDELEDWSQVPMHVVTQAVANGIVLYAKDASQPLDIVADPRAPVLAQFPHPEPEQAQDGDL